MILFYVSVAFGSEPITDHVLKVAETSTSPSIYLVSEQYWQQLSAGAKADLTEVVTQESEAVQQAKSFNQIELIIQQHEQIKQQKQFQQQYDMGSGAGNGGHSLHCSDRAPVLLDYYEATLPTLRGDFQVMDFGGIDLVTYFQMVFVPYDQFYYQFKQALEVIGHPSTWINASIKKSFDTEHAYNIAQEDCPDARIEQVALRQGEKVYLDREQYEALSKYQQELLYVHEVLYYIGWKFGNIQSSQVVRQIVRAALDRNFYKYHSKDIDPNNLETMRLLLQRLMGEDKNIKYGGLRVDSNIIDSLIEKVAVPMNYMQEISDSFSCMLMAGDNPNRFQLNLEFDYGSFKIVTTSSEEGYHRKTGRLVREYGRLMANFEGDRMMFYILPNEQLLIKLHEVNGQNLSGICQ